MRLDVKRWNEMRLDEMWKDEMNPEWITEATEEEWRGILVVYNEQVLSYLSKSNQDIKYVRVVVEHGSFFNVCVELRLGLSSVLR